VITGLAAWILVLGTVGALVFVFCFIVWCFISDWKWRKEQKQHEQNAKRKEAQH